MKSLSLTVIISTLLLASCSIPGSWATHRTHKPYHLENPVYPVNTLPRNLPNAKHRPYRLGFLEFDDQGEMWRTAATKSHPHGKTQLAPILKAIKEESKRGPLKVVVFIHGWNNNAKPTNANLINFKNILTSLPTKGNERVFGVYVSWRGQSYPFTTIVDVGTREASASRVGRAPLLSCLNAISVVTHQDKDNRLIAIGHSFGAKILAQVTSHYYANEFAAYAANSHNSKVSKRQDIVPLADTIILTNSAENAIIPRQMIAMMRDFKVKYQNHQNNRSLPLIVAISSDQDDATKHLLPLWNRIAKNVIGYPSKGGATSSMQQRSSTYNAMAFEPSIRTHKLVPMKLANEYTGIEKNVDPIATLVPLNVHTGAIKPKDSTIALKLFLYETDSVSAKPKLYGLQNLKDRSNNTPFWVMTVPAFISDGHGKIWNRNFLGLVAAIDGMSTKTTFYSKSSRQTKTKEAGKPKLEIQKLF